MNAPMAHLSVIAMFRDAQYETFFDANKVYEKDFAIRACITENVDARRIPKTEAPWRQPGSTPLDNNLLLPPKGTTNNPLRVPLDHRLVNLKSAQEATISTPPSRKENTIPLPRNDQDPVPTRYSPDTKGQGKGAVADPGTGYIVDTKGWGKGKRQPYEMASRFQTGQKFVRGGDTTPSPRTRTTMTMPTPPGACERYRKREQDALET